MNVEKLSKIVEIAIKDDINNLKVLKEELKNNDFKVCGMGVELMISQMIDLGMEKEQAIYWKTLGLTHLPYNPQDALKD